MEGHQNMDRLFFRCLHVLKSQFEVFTCQFVESLGENHHEFGLKLNLQRAIIIVGYGQDNEIVIVRTREV